jgi:hypothetical protein
VLGLKRKPHSHSPLFGHLKKNNFAVETIETFEYHNDIISKWYVDVSRRIYNVFLHIKDDCPR